MIGRTIGKYRILERIGRGGMGTVYRAIDQTLEREVAIKVLNAEVTEPEALKRFRIEAITLARLQHPAIATLFELTEDDGNLLMVMEFVRGETLQKLAERMGRVPPDFAAQLCNQALDGLWHAHRAGIVHRDLKPGNLMVTGDGIVKVMDFGIARITGSEHLTSDGFTMGTPAYMAPEQVRGEEVDARSDIYAMGVVLYRLWTGQLPFQGETPFAIAHRQLNEAPPPLKDVAPDLPSWCDLVLSRAIAKNPSERYQTALEFKNALATAATFMSLDDVATVTLRTPRAVMLPTLTPSRPVSTDSSRAAPASQPSRAQEVVSTPRSTSAAQPAAAPPMITSPSATVPVGTPAAGTAQTPVAQPASGPVTATPPTTGRTVVISPRHVFAGVTSLMIVLVVLAIGTVLAVKRIQQQKLVAEQAAATTTVAPPSPPAAPTAPAPPQADASTPSSGSAAAATPDVPSPAAPPPVASPAPASAPAKAAGTTVGKAAAGVPAGVQANGKSPAPSTTPLPAKPLPSPSPPTGSPAPAADTLPPVSFDKVKLLVVEGDKAREDDAELRFANGTVQILGASDRVIGSIPYQSVHTVTSTRSKQPRWRGPDGAVVDAKMSSGAFGFLKSDRNWVGLVTPSAAYVFRVDDGDLQKLTETVTKRTGARLVRMAGK
jgi:serine/threonine-protein kinase